MIGFNAMLSLMTSRLGLVAIAAVLGCWFGYSAASQGAKVRALQTDNKALKQEVAQARAALDRANAAAETAAREADGLRVLQQDLAEKVETYAAELSKRQSEAQAFSAAADCDPRGACRLDGSDIERLRGLE